LINALQHVGIGVTDVAEAYEFYRRRLGFKFKVGESEYDVWELEPMFGRKVRMHIHNSFNASGGPGLELFQHKDTNPRTRPVSATLSDIGILELGIRVQNLDHIFDNLKGLGIDFLTNIEELQVGSSEAWKFAYLRSPDGILIQLLETDDSATSRTRRAKVLGISHVGLGTSDLERARSFYGGLLGFDKLIWRQCSAFGTPDRTGPVGEELEVLMLGRTAGSTASLCSLDGGMIKLFHCRTQPGERVFKGRRFGDPGLTEIAFDVDDIHTAYAQTIKGGAKPLVPPTDFDWGFGPRGALAYVADFDGNVIELVQIRSLFKMSPALLNLLVIRPMRLLGKMGAI